MSEKKERQMTQKEINQAFQKMCDIYEKKHVDFDNRMLLLGVEPPKVWFVKNEERGLGVPELNIFINFTKEEPVDYEDFNFDDYPEEVKEILSQCEDQDFFPNIIFTPQGEDILDAIEKMTKMSILLDYGWELAYDYDTYESEHPEAFDQDSGW